MKNVSLIKILTAAVLAAGLAACAAPKKAEQPAPAAAGPTDTAPATGAAAPAPDTTANGLPASYSVKRGDHLWGIASNSRIYGNPYQWPLLYKANRDKINDPDLIEPGQNLAVNRNASAADVNAAVHHAKTRGEWKLGVVEESDKRYLAK
jgi:nucleoid-associated protein YgaU